MSDIDNKEVTNAEKSFAEAVQKWLGNYKDAVFGVAGAMAGAQMEQAAQEIKKYMYGGNNTSTLLGLYHQGQASNKICLLKTGSAILTKGVTGLAISDAFVTDVKNGTPDQTLKTTASLTLAYGIGSLATAVIGTGVAAAATVALLGAGIYIYIDSNWEGIKREGLSYIWNDYVNGISNIIYDAMIALDDDAKAVMNEKLGVIQSCLTQNAPNSIDDLYNSMLTNNPDQLDNLGQLLGDNFCPLKNNPIKEIIQLKETAEVTPSPLIVDLDGDGVETMGTKSGTHFDHDGNGFAENTGWVKVKSLSEVIIPNTMLRYSEAWSNLHRTTRFI